MKAIRTGFSLTTAFTLFTWLVFWGTTFVGSAQTPSSGLTVEDFFNAVHGNDVNTVSNMLEANSNLVQAFYYSRLPINVAAEDGSDQIVELLLKHGADVNGQNKPGNMQFTALEAAVLNGKTNLCKLMLEAGANPDIQCGMEGSALQYAFDHHQPEMAAWLLDYGADPFLPNQSYNPATPFELAITRDDGKLVSRMLGQEGAGPTALKPARPLPWKKNPAQNRAAAAKIIAEHGTQLLSAAAQRGELEAVEALLKEGVSAKTNAPGELPVLEAFAISEATAVKSRPSAVAQWQQSSNMVRNFGPNADPKFTAQFRTQAAEQGSRIAALDPDRLLKIRDLLIKNGADYDAFAATAMADTKRAAQLLAADKNVIQARDRDGQTPLHWAVLNDQPPLTSFWLQAGASPAATNIAGQTPLHIAATKGLTGQVKLLLAANAPTNIRDTNGWTPLDAAIQAKQTDCIHLLMATAPADAHPERGLATTLHSVAASGNIAALAALLDTETNLEARNELGLTPLQVAVLHGHLAAAALLVDKGADAKVRDPAGNTLLHQILLQDRLDIYDRPPANWLARAGQDPTKQLYVKYLTVGQNVQGPNPLLQAASFLLASGADATAKNNAGQTAMQLIAEEKTGRGVFFFDNEQTELLQLLGAHGSSANERDADGNTALHRLSTVAPSDMRNLEAMTSLIASGADVNATNNLGQTPLHLSAEMRGGWQGYERFQMLISSNANVNAQDNQGLTPLHVLAQSDTTYHKAATRALLDAGAKPNLRDKQGRTPAHLFFTRNRPWLYDDDDAECIEMLAAAGADVSAKDDQGKTPLHYLAAVGANAASFFVRDSVNIFVSAKVDLNARDNAGDTPLHIAARAGTSEFYALLVAHGCDQDATNNTGETPRRLAMHSNEVRFRMNTDTDIFHAIYFATPDSVAAILKSSPDLLNQTNPAGQTPLLAAAQTRHTNMVDLLDAHGARWDPVSAVLMGRAEVLRKLVSEQPRLASAGLALGLAAANDNVAAVEILLAASPDLKATDQNGLSPLGNAIVHHHDDVVELLVKQGATKNIFDAVYSDDAETAARLLERDKALVSATNGFGVSLAEIAAACGNEKTLKLLLDKGVSPNFQSPLTGRSLLHAAATYNQTNTAQLLIQRRAKLDAADNFGFAPIHVSALMGSADVLELLRKHKADCNQGTIPASSVPPMMGFPPEARQLLAGGNTALHLAALAGQTNVIVVLLKWGASVNATNAYGLTPLDLTRITTPPPFLLMRSMDMRLPVGPPLSSGENSRLHRDATIALLEQAGGKHGERRGLAGTMPFGPPTMAGVPNMRAAPVPPAPILQTGADYHNQGCVDYNAHQFTNALADFRKAGTLGSENQDYSYFRIWLIRARLGEKEAATQELAAYLERRKAQTPDDWPAKVGHFLAGQLSESDFLKAADNPNLQTSKEQHCEAYFYVGSKHLIENDKMAAVDYFKKCLTTNVTDFEEFTSAATELLFLQGPQTNGRF